MELGGGREEGNNGGGDELKTVLGEMNSSSQQSAKAKEQGKRAWMQNRLPEAQRMTRVGGVVGRKWEQGDREETGISAGILRVTGNLTGCVMVLNSRVQWLGCVSIICPQTSFLMTKLAGQSRPHSGTINSYSYGLIYISNLNQ